MIPPGAGATPYVPFENKLLEWLDPERESASAAISRRGGPRPAILLFLARSDGDACMAKNFERVVFRDAKVIALAKERFVTVRAERTSDAAKAFAVKGPELVIQDAEGEEVARFVECTDAALVLEIMDEALRNQRETARVSATVAPRLERAARFLDEGRTADAASIVVRARRERRLSRVLREKADELARALEARAVTGLDEARGLDAAGDAASAWRSYRKVRDGFPGLEGAAAAKAAMTALEKDPEKKVRLREARADEALDAARELANAGRKGQALVELRRIASEFEGTPAADEARRLASEVSDPSWKPSPPPAGAQGDADPPESKR